MLAVTEVTDGDAEAILQKSVQAVGKSCVVRLRGLPFSCSEADVVQFFSGKLTVSLETVDPFLSSLLIRWNNYSSQCFVGLEIVENGVTIVTDHRGRKSGDAFVRFCSQAAADEALLRDRDVMGNR